MKQLSKRQDLAEACERLDEASEYMRRKLTQRLSRLEDDEESEGDVPPPPPARATLPTLPREEAVTIPDRMRRLA
jgi:hypothetical protein